MILMPDQEPLIISSPNPFKVEATPATALSNNKLVNNPNASAGVTFKVDGANVYTPVTTLSAGVKAAFYMDEAELGQQLQVLTRDGRQLLGQALTETEKYQLLKPSNGFAANATYTFPLNDGGETVEVREKKVYMRDAAYMISIKRVAEACHLRGWV